MGDSESMSAILDDLQRESDRRRAELRDIAAQLPATMSRTALLRAAVSSVYRAPNKPEMFGRAARKLARAPRALARRVARGQLRRR